jgi:hypothetical protein
VEWDKMLTTAMNSRHQGRLNTRFRVVLYLSMLLLSVGCAETTVENLTDYSADSLPVAKGEDTTTSKALLGPLIDPMFYAKLPPCDGFDYPVGPPNAKRYFKARGFLPNGLEHLGEDWNGDGGGNSDFGDYVYAAADGVVFYSTSMPESKSTFPPTDGCWKTGFNPNCGSCERSSKSRTLYCWIMKRMAM